MTNIGKFIIGLVVAWSPMVLYVWANSGGPEGAANLSWAIIWIILFLQSLMLVSFSESFAKENPDIVKKNISELPNINQSIMTFMSDTPDVILLAFSAWNGDGWMAFMAFCIWLTGMMVRHERDERKKEFYNE